MAKFFKVVVNYAERFDVTEGLNGGGGRLLFYDGNSLVRLCSPLLLLYSLSGRIQCITSTGWAAITKNKERRKENKNARI